MKVKIVSDSTSDLSKGLIEKYSISILPLHIVMGDAEYEDGKSITPDEIFEWSDKNRTTPSTSAPSISEAMDLFRKLTTEECQLVCFSISEQMSATNNVMKMAAEELGMEDRIKVVDSANLSTGIGLLVVEAAVMAQHGMNADDIVQEIEKLKPRVKASFVVDTLTYLHRGGRCSGLAALAGGALKLHPKITVENGKMKPDKKYRGKMDSVIIKYVKEMTPELINAKEDRVFITHSGCDKELVESVKTYLEATGRFKEILETRAGGVISSHCGPGTLGVLFIGEE